MFGPSWLATPGCVCVCGEGGGWRSNPQHGVWEPVGGSPGAKREHSDLKPFSSAGWEEEFFIPTGHWF